jgi:uncharacterized damage-inducible protein DinB
MAAGMWAIFCEGLCRWKGESGRLVAALWLFAGAIPTNWRTMMTKRVVVVLALAVCSVTGARGQMGQTAPKVPAGTIIEPSKSFDALLKIYESEMMGAVNAMPADKYNFAPSPAIFKAEQGVKYDTVRTFGQMVAHVAQANYYFYSTLGGAKPDVDMKAMGNLTSKEDTVKALADSFAYAHKQIATLTAANAFASVKDDQTKASMAAFGIAHGFDHYGQLVEYLRMNGIVPPASQK